MSVIPSTALPLVALGLLGVAATTVAARFVPYLVVHTALSGPAFAALVYGIALQPNWASWLNNRLLVLFGNASYSFYLLHSMFVWPFFHNLQTQEVRNQGFVGIGLWLVMMLTISSPGLSLHRGARPAQAASPQEGRSGTGRGHSQRGVRAGFRSAVPVLVHPV